MSAIIGIAALGSFTFHYVSINTDILTNIIGGVETFTFHYVSINTVLDILESTNVSQLYIPLCFY